MGPINRAELTDCLQKILGGSYEAAKSAAKASSLPTLCKNLLVSDADFESGEVYVASNTRWFEVLIWRLYIGPWVGRIAVNALVDALFFVLMILGLRERFVYFIAAREVPNLPHYRYTSFIKGLVYSLLLYRGSTRKHALYKAVFKSQLSHHLGLSGRFDLATPIGFEAVAALRDFNSQANSTGIDDLMTWMLYVEGVCKLFLVYLYTSDHGKCAAALAEARAQFELHEYRWIQMFFSVMSVQSATEKLDKMEMTRAAADLQKSFGNDVFSSRFGLRFAGFTGLLLAFDGDYFNAQTQIIRSEELYRISKAPLERARYHYTRSLTEMELQRFDKAAHHANKALSMLAPVQGGIFHTTEGELLRIEVVLRSLYAQPSGQYNKHQVSKAAKDLQRMRRKIRGSGIHDVRIKVLSLFIQYIRGDYLTVQQRMPAVREGISAISKRYEKILHQLQPGANQSATATLSYDEILHKQNSDMIDHFSLLCNADDLRQRSIDVVKLVFGSNGVSLSIGSRESVQKKKYEVEFTGEITTFVVFVGAESYHFAITDSVISSINLEMIESLLSLFATLLNVTNLRRLEGEKARVDAIAKTTQMLAHDVRKPFSILRMGLGMLGNAKDPAGVKRILSSLMPQIDKAVSSVDGLIADVMEVGSTSTQLIQEPVSPESLIEATLGETFRIYLKSDIAITYDLRHVHMVDVHTQKVGRVFSNIVGNAVQAMGYKGDMWFKTREQDGIVEFCIGNAGSLIPADSLTKLFDAFFTSGKKGGTGLGLAIAQKVVTAHGGRIWCESSKTAEHPEGKVEFFFTLPVAPGIQSKNTATLPGNSSDITKALAIVVAQAQSTEGNIGKGELTLEADIIQCTEKASKQLRILVVDDEAIYRSGLASYLSRTPELEAAIIFDQADGSTAALEAMAASYYDLVITDVDMGCQSLSGFELVSRLRESGHAGMICVHSNRIVAEDHKTAIEAGANAFLPKPMARGHLLKLLLQSFPSQLAHGSSAKPVSKAVAVKRPEVLVVEDNVFMLEAWEDMLKGDVVVYAFTSPEDLVAKIAEDENFLERLSCVITDMNFEGSLEDGYGVAKIVKDKRLTLPVLLCTDGDFNLTTPSSLIDQVIAKDPVKYIDLVGAHRESARFDQAVLSRGGLST